MAMSRRTPRSRFTVVVLLMVCLTLVTADSRANGGGVTHTVRSKLNDVLAPGRSGLGGVVGSVADFADGLANSGDVKAENKRLREDNERLQGNNLKLADAERERRALLDLNKLDFAGDIPRVAARVVNTAPSNLALTVEIDRGIDNGVAPGMPVVVGSGLVGRIESTTGRRAVVLLLTDDSLNVGVRLATSGIQCLVRGRGASRPLAGELVKPDIEVAEDEVVVTSGLQGSKYPPGIPVGTVSRAEAQAGVAYQDVDVRPSVDFSRLEFVQVLQWRA